MNEKVITFSEEEQEGLIKFFRDRTISFSAKGLYAYLLEHPPIGDKEKSREIIRKYATDTDENFEKAWAELKERGYVK